VLVWLVDADVDEHVAVCGKNLSLVLCGLIGP